MSNTDHIDGIDRVDRAASATASTSAPASTAASAAAAQTLPTQAVQQTNGNGTTGAAPTQPAAPQSWSFAPPTAADPSQSAAGASPFTVPGQYHASAGQSPIGGAFAGNAASAGPAGSTGFAGAAGTFAPTTPVGMPVTAAAVPSAAGQGAQANGTALRTLGGKTIGILAAIALGCGLIGGVGGGFIAYAAAGDGSPSSQQSGMDGSTSQMPGGGFGQGDGRSGQGQGQGRFGQDGSNGSGSSSDSGSSNGSGSNTGASSGSSDAGADASDLTM